MIKKKLLKIQNQTKESDLSCYQINSNSKKSIMNVEKVYGTNNTARKNLPELKLGKYKNKISFEDEENTKDELNKMNRTNKSKQKKSVSQIKKRKLIFPSINRNKNFVGAGQYNSNNVYNGNINKKNVNNVILNINLQKKKNLEHIPINSIDKKANIHNKNNLNPINNKIEQLHNPHNTHNVHTNNLLPINFNTPKERLNDIKDKKETNEIKNLLNKKNKEIQNKCDIDLKELNLMTERLNLLNSLFNSLNSMMTPNGTKDTNTTSGLSSLIKPKEGVELSSAILTQDIKNFIPATYSALNEIPNTEIIKAFAYITNQGNIRDYNEDTITAKLINNEFYFFGVYDGHGGNGCSIYLRDYLHTYIKDFSVDSINNAINQCEDDFIKNKALTKDMELLDSSGSCGVMALIKQNKCIIANVGDSRLIVFKNNKIQFVTDDHKPNSKVEKLRIETAGGSLYQTQTLFPLYQNGKLIEAPWRVLPGRLSVSRTFGDVEAKEPKFGGMKGVVAAIPDITEIDIDNDTNFICIGCDGIFDVLENDEILECARIVLRQFKNEDINIKCKEIANMILKASMAKDSFDNVSCIIIAINLDGISL